MCSSSALPNTVLKKDPSLSQYFCWFINVQSLSAKSMIWSSGV